MDGFRRGQHYQVRADAKTFYAYLSQYVQTPKQIDNRWCIFTDRWQKNKDVSLP
jgi:hypothetical protein